MGWLVAIGNLFGFLNKLFLFIKERQLREDERNKIKLEQSEADNEARNKAKAIKEANSALSDSNVVVKLSKYTRKRL